MIYKLLLSFTLAYLALTQNITTTTPTTAIVTGPIIGKVTTTTARVLIEFNSAIPITVILTDPIGTQFPVTKNVTASIPTPFTFEGLLPNTKYTVDPSIVMVQSYFTTLSGIPGKLHFAVVSCLDKNVQLSKPPHQDLWADMLRRPL